MSQVKSNFCYKYYTYYTRTWNEWKPLVVKWWWYDMVVLKCNVHWNAIWKWTNETHHSSTLEIDSLSYYHYDVHTDSLCKYLIVIFINMYMDVNVELKGLLMNWATFLLTGTCRTMLYQSHEFKLFLSKLCNWLLLVEVKNLWYEGIIWIRKLDYGSSKNWLNLGFP